MIFLKFFSAYIEDPDWLGLSLDQEDKILHPDDTQDTNMAATSGANPSGSLAEVKLLSSAILSLTKRLDKLEETPSTKGKGKGRGKRSSQEPQSEVPAKKPAKGCSCSMSEQNALDSKDCQTLMEKITQEGNESATKSEDEILAEMQKEYEAEDSIGKDIQNPQLAKLLGKMFCSRLPDKILEDKLERQDRPENCETAKPTISRYLVKAL